jgi:UDP-N-acetylglucosamine--N-acetylmuramyl-(pentapeptide) pyrophosphoryl-undecaprenol N-acetylglucosamine transferase
VVAIAAAIKQSQADASLLFVTDKRYFRHSVELFEPLGVSVAKVSAGKFRRYANLTLADHLRHIFKSYLPNVVDLFKFGIGIIQAYFKILRFRPDVIFIKGGYVGLPVGLAAAKFFRKTPIVLHDSDAHPGLTNRILSKYAVKIGVGMPLEFSEYDKSKTEFVGVPIASCFAAVIASAAKQSSHKPLVLAIGGSQGSKVVNEQIVKIAPDFAGRADFVLVAGEDKFQAVIKPATKLTFGHSGLDPESRHDESHGSRIKSGMTQGQSSDNLKVLPFVSEEEMCKYMKESEIVITRAGATTMAEIAAVGAPAIIIPSPYLASDHQTKNAEIFDGNGAAFVVYEKDLAGGELSDKINQLLNDDKLRQQFSKNIRRFSKPNAAKRMSEIIIEVGNGQEKH